MVPVDFEGHRLAGLGHPSVRSISVRYYKIEEVWSGEREWVVVEMDLQLLH